MFCRRDWLPLYRWPAVDADSPDGLELQRSLDVWKMKQHLNGTNTHHGRYAEKSAFGASLQHAGQWGADHSAELLLSQFSPQVDVTTLLEELGRGWGTQEEALGKKIMKMLNNSEVI